MAREKELVETLSETTKESLVNHVLSKLDEWTKQQILRQPDTSAQTVASQEEVLRSMKAQIMETELHLRETFDSMSSSKQACLDLLQEKQDLQVSLGQLRAEKAGVTAEKASREELFEFERRRFDSEIAHLRTALQTRDKQVDALRSELLNRATAMDEEAKERERLQAEQATVTGGIETELAIMRTKAEQANAEKGGLREELAEARQKLQEVGKERQSEVVRFKQSEAGLQAKASGLEHQLRSRVS